jgi:FkbH-like protein
MSSQLSDVDRPVSDKQQQIAALVRDSVLRADCQRVLFSTTLQARDILGIAEVPGELIKVKANIHRNQGFEIIARLMTPFSAFAGYALETSISSYDDSLSFRDYAAADVEIIWLDYSRYLNGSDPKSVADFVQERISALRSMTDRPILINSCEAADPHSVRLNEHLSAQTRDRVGVHLCDLPAALREVGSISDARSQAITGTRLSSQAMAGLARSFALQWLPAAIFPRVKAIAVDLDETLYAGVLGEDGMDVRLTAGHRLLHEKLIELQRDGIFLILVSKNARSDVEQLFRQRTDFPLRLEHFSHVCVDWNGKAEAIRQAAANLRIGVDSVVFVDDNPGEIISVVSTLPGIRTLHASNHGEWTARSLDLFPGVFSWRSSDTDRLRVADANASLEREQIASRYDDPLNYLASLQVAVRFDCNDRGQIERLTELSNRTNQFNLSLKRLTAAQVQRYMDGQDTSVVAIAMRDRLSDSGNVGAVFLRFADNVLTVEELCLSCRALGRSLEDLLVLGAILRGHAGRAIGRLNFDVKIGPRNEPARRWLSQLIGKPVDRLTSREEITWSAQQMRARLAQYPVMAK